MSGASHHHTDDYLQKFETVAPQTLVHQILQLSIDLCRDRQLSVDVNIINAYNDNI